MVVAIRMVTASWGQAHGGAAWALWTSQKLKLRAMSNEIGAHEDSEAQNDSTRTPAYH
jgi:hypothetical protein